MSREHESLKLTEERHSFYKGNKTSVNLETSESPSSAGKLLRKTGSLRQALAGGSDKVELQTEEYRGSVMGRQAGSARRACNGCMVSALDMDRLLVCKFKWYPNPQSGGYVLPLLPQRDK